MFRVRVIYSLLLLIPQMVCSQFGSPGVEYLIKPLSICTEANEYAPFLANSELFFTSDNYDRFGVYLSSTDSMSRLSGVFQVTVTNDTVFGKPAALGKQVNGFSNSGPACLSADGTRIFFSANEETSFLFSPGKQKSKLKIYTSDYRSGSWGKRLQLSLNSDSGNYTHPSLNKAGDTLFFASDRPEGYGGFDIWYCALQGDQWTAPVNMGPEVNSSGNELFPVMNGSLIYASDRKGGFGKLDLYSYRLTDQTAVHLDARFNSPEDDFGLISVNERKGYFTSGRSGNDDIYFFTDLFPAFENCEPYEKDKFCFTFFEETDELEEEMSLDYEWSLGDGTVIKGKEARHCFDGYGEYLVELNIVDRSTNAVFFTQSSYPFLIEPTERLHINGPDTVPLFATSVWTAENSVIPGYEIEHIYWEADNGTFRSADSDTAAIVFAEPGIHSILLGVKAKSTEDGVLEQFCITTTVTALDGFQPVARIRKLPVSRHAEEAPVENYTLFLGLSDTLVENAQMGGDSLQVESLGDSLYLYSVGHAANKFDLLEDYRGARELGFSDSRVAGLDEDGELIGTERLAATEMIDPDTLNNTRIALEEVLTSCEIFYGYDVYELTAENRKQLADLAVNYPLTGDRRILISSFTDSKGSVDYNLKLSKKRSESVKNALIALGFPAERIETEFYGNRVPLEMEPFTDAQRRKSLIIIYEKN